MLLSFLALVAEKGCGTEPLFLVSAVAAFITACVGESSLFVSAMDSFSITMSLCLLVESQVEIH